MAVLPTMWGMQGGGRNRQPMNYAMGAPTDTTNGGGQGIATTPIAGGPPRYTGFAPANSVYANANMRQGYGIPTGFNRGFGNQGFATMPSPAQRAAMMSGQMGGMNPMMGKLAGQMGNVQVPAGMNISNFAGGMGGMQGGVPYNSANMRPFMINPNMLVQMRNLQGIDQTYSPNLVQQRRGVLPTGY